MVYWVLSLAVFNVIISLSRLFFAALIENRVLGNTDKIMAYTWETIDIWILNVYIPIVDLSTQFTFLYLFYFQAKSKINANKAAQDPDRTGST